MDAAEVRQRIEQWFADSFGASPPAIRLDIGDEGETYRLVDPDWVDEQLRADPRVQPALYQSGLYDCEDYAFAARSCIAYQSLVAAPAPVAPPAFGVLVTRVHALNIGIDEQRKPWLLDVVTGVRWRQPTLTNALADKLGDGWLRPASVRYLFI